MFGFGFWEIVILGLAVIIFVNPKELPKLFYRIGRIYGQLQEFNRNVRRTMRQFERQIAESSDEDFDKPKGGSEAGEGGAGNQAGTGNQAAANQASGADQAPADGTGTQHKKGRPDGAEPADKDNS